MIYYMCLGEVYTVQVICSLMVDSGEEVKIIFLTFYLYFFKTLFLFILNFYFLFVSLNALKISEWLLSSYLLWPF